MNLKFVCLPLTLTLLGVATLAGCASTSQSQASPDKSPEAVVRERAKARWDALIAGDTEKAYQFLQPSYRAVRNLNFYRGTIAGGAVQWKNAEVVGVECKTEVCSATIRIEYVPVAIKAAGGVLMNHFDEQWVSDQGAWWLYQRP